MTNFNLFGDRSVVNAVAGRSNSNYLGNVAVRVTGYDLEAKPELLLGVNLKTGEDVRVALNSKEVEKRHKTTSKAAPSIVYLAQGGNSAELNKRKVKEGGIVLFSDVFDSGEYLSAGWVMTLRHNSKSYQDGDGNLIMGDTETLSYIHAPANFTVWASKAGDKGVVLTMLLSDPNYQDNLSDSVKEFLSVKGHPIVAKEYKDVAGVEKYCKILFEKGLGAVIRVRMLEASGTAFNVIAVEPLRMYGEKQDDPNEFYAQRIGKHLANDAVTQLLAEGKITLEVIPVLRVHGNKNMKAEALNPNSGIHNLHSAYNVETVNGKQVLYKPTHIALYKHPDNPVISLSSAQPDRAVDAYIGLDSAGFFAKTSFAQGDEEGLNAMGWNLADYVVKYVPRQKAVESVLAAAQQAVASGALPQEPVINNFDDDIPF